MKLTTRCRTEAVLGWNEALVAKAAKARLLRTTQLRADTSAVPSDVAYPTDSGLPAKAVQPIAATGRRVQVASCGGQRAPPEHPSSLVWFRKLSQFDVNIDVFGSSWIA